MKHQTFANNDNTPEPRVKRWPPAGGLAAVTGGAALGWAGVNWAFHHPVQFCVGCAAYAAMGVVFCVVLKSNRDAEFDRLESEGQYADADAIEAIGWLQDGALWPLAAVAFIGNAALTVVRLSRAPEKAVR
jgi:hypothetical protein